MERIVELDIGCTPEAAVSGAVLFQTETSTFLTFNAMREANNGKVVRAGTAVVEFKHCTITQFGYPNDEAWAGIPRTQGLVYGFYEVLNSEWKTKLTSLNRFAFPNTVESEDRHFLVLFHDSSFECIADDFTVETTYEKDHEIWARLVQKTLKSACA